MTETVTYSGRTVETFGFANYAGDRYPLLKIAAANSSPLHSAKAEWLVDGPNGVECWANYAQIVRTCFDEGPGNQEEALQRHLAAAESILWDGVPDADMPPAGKFPYQKCGGVIHYLGRNPIRADQVSLAVLRDLVLLRDEGRGEHEFLSEFSLRVVPATPIRRAA